MTHAKLLIVQGGDPGTTCLAERLQGMGYSVCAAVSCGRQAIEKAAAMRPDLALIDLALKGDVSGIEVAEGIGSRIPVIYLADGAEENLLQWAQTTRPFGYVLKPIEERQLHLNIQTALSLHGRETKLKEREQRVEAELRKTKEDLQKKIDELHDYSILLNTAFETISDGVLITDKDGNHLISNPGLEGMIGKPEPDPGQWSETYGLYYPDRVTHIPIDNLQVGSALRGGVLDNAEIFIRNIHRPEGIYALVSGRPMQDESGSIIGAVLIVRDVTQIRKAEIALQKTADSLQEQTQLMDTVFNSIRDGILIADEKGKYIIRNSSAKEMVRELSGDVELDRHPEEYGLYHLDRETFFLSDELPVARAIRGETVDDVEMFMCNQMWPDGIYISVSGRPLWGEEGVVKGAVILFRNITKTKQTEDQLKQTIVDLEDQKQLMNTIFNSISDGVIAVDKDGKHLICNRSAKRMGGTHRPNNNTARWSEKYGIFYLDKETHVPADKLPLVRAMRGERIDNLEFFVRNRRRSQGVYMSASGRPLRDSAGILKGGVIVTRDITKIKQADIELKQTMRDLRNQNELMEATFNSISDGIVVANAEGQFLYVNPNAEQIVGLGATDTSPDEWAEKYGTFYPDRKTPIKTEDLPLLRAIFQGESTDDEDLFIRNAKRPDGVYIRVSGRPLLNDIGGIRGGVIIFRDVTRQMVAEEALERAFAQGRLEIVDTILHNIGNAINSITIGIETVHENMLKDHLVRRLCALADAVKARRDDWGDYIKNDAQGQKVMPFIIALAEDFTVRNEAWVKTVDRVRDRAKHIADIVRTQKAIGRPSVDRTDVDLRGALKDAVKVLQDSISKRGIRVEIDCKNAPKEIRIQESQFHQMMVNLIKNSIEAIDELATSGGLEDRPRIQIRSYIEEDFLNFEVSDNGIGIENTVLKKLFAAGYTTKKLGTGLGLHSAANFVIGTGGRIYPLSDGIGKGTTMHIRLLLASVTPPQRGDVIPPSLPIEEGGSRGGPKVIHPIERAIDDTRKSRQQPHLDRG